MIKEEILPDELCDAPYEAGSSIDNG